MSNLISNIFQIKKSKPYIDYNNYHKGNIFGITKMSRRELMHSNFIAWALNPKSSHGLRFYPLYQLVQSLNSLQANENNKDARKIPSELVYNFCDDDFIIDASIVRESPVPVGNNRKYIDILIEIITKDKILPIIIGIAKSRDNLIMGPLVMSILFVFVFICKPFFPLSSMLPEIKEKSKLFRVQNTEFYINFT